MLTEPWELQKATALYRLILISVYSLNNYDFISCVYSKNVKFFNWYAFAQLKETFNKNGCISVDNRLDSTLRSTLNILVITICLISFILCSRAIYRAQQLKAVRIISHYTVFTLLMSLNETPYSKKVSNECNERRLVPKLMCCRDLVDAWSIIAILFLNCPPCDACIYVDTCLLFQVTMNFFQKTLKKDLSPEGRLEFLNMWYIMIIVNDILIILGSAIKEQIERQVSSDICSFMCKGWR